MRQIRLFTITSIIFIIAGFISFTNVSKAAEQTLTILGAQGLPGDLDPHTQFSQDSGLTWSQAYLYGAHPWGFINGTNSYMNCGPSGFDCLGQTYLYRIQFDVPDDFTDPQMTFEIYADNYALIYLNDYDYVNNNDDNEIMNVSTYGKLVADSSINGKIHAGLNEIVIKFTDAGGWAGINYKLTLDVESSSAPTIVIEDTIAPITTDDAPDHWVNKEIIVNLTVTDNYDTSVVAATYYTLNGGAPLSGNSIVLAEDGAHTIEYWSVDQAGNVEDIHSIIVNVKLVPLDSNGQFHINDVVTLINQGVIQQQDMNGDSIFDYSDIHIMLNAITPMYTSSLNY